LAESVCTVQADGICRALSLQHVCCSRPRTDAEGRARSDGECRRGDCRLANCGKRDQAVSCSRGNQERDARGTVARDRGCDGPASLLVERDLSYVRKTKG